MSNPGSPPDSAMFLISPDQKAKYDLQFKKLCHTGDYITGDQAKGIMLQSGLPPQVLAHIWALSDVDADGKMDINEFSIALHLIALRMKGVEVPRTLPQSLKILVAPPAFAAFNNNDLANNSPKTKSAIAQAAVANSISPTMSINSKMGSLTNLVSSQSNGKIGMVAAPSAGVGSMASSASSGAEWAIPQQSKLKYTQQFNSHDRSRTGFLTGNQARSILLESKLPQAILAQIWNLSDIDVDGRLTCEEFVLAMYLIDRAQNKESLWAKLPSEFIPPSYRRGGGIGGGVGGGGVSATTSSGNLSHASSVEEASIESDGILGKHSFEDKRRENFEKGQAELDRRRAALAEQQRREKEERERKEREDRARKEKERLEAERKRQEEIERNQQRLRDAELEKEENKRRANEVRELARKEMERQRQKELEQVRRSELMAQRTKLMEEVQKLKSRRKALTIEHEQMDKRLDENKMSCTLSREKVVRVKQQIDGMRKKRDETMAKQADIKAQIKTFTEKQLFVEQEKVRLAAQLKSLIANQTNGINTEQQQQQLTSFASLLQSKQLTVNQLRSQLERYEKELLTKKADIQNNRKDLIDLKKRYARERSEACGFNALIEGKKIEAERVRDSDGSVGGAGYGNNRTSQEEEGVDVVWGQEVPTNFEWPAADKPGAAASAISTTTKSLSSTTQPNNNNNNVPITRTKFKYRCLYAFQGRNSDEITIEPDDIILVDTSACSEPDWLSGEIRGKIGWFPKDYAVVIEDDEEVVENEVIQTTATLATTTVTSGGDSQLTSNAATVTSGGITESAATAASAILPQQAKALYDYSSTESGHVSFYKDDIIRITEKHDEWYFGELLDAGGNVSASGWFIGSYVQIIGDSGIISNGAVAGAATAAATSGGDQYYISLYCFDSIEPGDLSFDVNELILVEKKDGDWWTGVVVERTSGVKNENRRGVFPSNYVGEATEADIPATTTTTTTAPAVAAAATSAVVAKEPAVVATTVAPVESAKPIQPQHQPLDRKESEPCDSPKPTKKSKAKKLEIVTVIAPYSATGAEQLTLEAGQLISVRKKMPSGWWEGELQAKGKKKQVGWFPASFVKPLGAATAAVGGAGGNTGSAGSSARSTPDPGLKNSTTTTSGGAADEPEIDRVIALYPFHASRSEEMDFEANDTIRVLSKPDPTWWRGHNTRTDAIGLFPFNHVQVAGTASTAPPSAPNNNNLNEWNNDNNPTKTYDYNEDSFDDDSEDDVRSNGTNSIQNNQIVQQNNWNRYDVVDDQDDDFDDDSFDDDSETDDFEDNRQNQQQTQSQQSQQQKQQLQHSPSSISRLSSNSSLNGSSPKLYKVQIFSDLNRISKKLTNSSNGNNKLLLSPDQINQKRLYLIEELLATEEAYIKDLYFTLENFKDPLERSALLKPDELNLIFSNLDSIYQTNYEFFNELYTRIQSSSTPSVEICDLLLRYLRQMLPLYKKFCSVQVSGARFLQQRLENDPQFTDCLRTITINQKSLLPLSSYLLKPMQRITKYPLLIEKIHSTTSSDHPDFQACCETVQLSKTFCKEINEACRETENFEKLYWLQKHVVIDLKMLDYPIDFNSETRLLGPRQLLHEGILLKATSSKSLVVFLFNDFLMLTIASKRSNISNGSSSGSTGNLSGGGGGSGGGSSNTSSGTNFFYNKKALESNYKLYRQPLFLNDLTIANMPEFESQIDPSLFRIYIASQKRYITFRAYSANDCQLWLKQIDRAKKQYNDVLRMHSEQSSAFMAPSIATNKPVGKIYITIVEAIQLYSHNAVLNAYCKLSIGQEWTNSSPPIESSPIRVQIDKEMRTLTRKGHRTLTLSSANKSSSSSSLSLPGSSIVLTRDGSLQIGFNFNCKFNIMSKNLAEQDHLLFGCFDQNPFAPHQCLAGTKLSLSYLIEQCQAVDGPLTLNLPLSQGSNRSLFSNNGLKTKETKSQKSDDNQKQHRRSSSWYDSDAAAADQFKPSVLVKVDFIKNL